MTYVLFDIGGTNTRISFSEDLTSFDHTQKFKTPQSFEEGIKNVADIITQQCGSSVRAIAGGVRGSLSEDRSQIVRDDILSDWVDRPIVESLSSALRTKVFLENDAALAGLGEAHFGAGKGQDIVVYHTVSTGVGGAKIERGVIDGYNVGFEPGRQILDIDRTILGDDILPTLENLVSGTALENRTGEKPYDIPQEDAVWDQLAFYLAHGLRNSVLYWSPDIIVLGGSMIIGNPRILLSDIIKHTEVVLDGEADCPPIVDAKLGDYAGLYGAMALLSQKM